ncbi:prenyltransferase [Kineobactrum sediminis]|uniref:Prenyltransferase n=2 Tax=Kineobactrum sediminis TaxID=1905677 RepID=A0A2N5XYG3_9GAMM|nr:prenyltransferase [Kineobactrum sediminis]
MTLTAAILGGLLAWRDGYFNGLLWLACCLGLLFAHATNNLLNDYTDSRRGIDRDNYYRNQYGVHVLEDGLMSRAQFWRYFAVTAAIALALGLWLVSVRSGPTLALLLAGAFFVLFYTWPLKYIGLGEPSVLLVWGPLMVGGTYYVVTGSWSNEVALLSLVFALGPTTVLFGKHIDKLDADRDKGVRTLPVLLGERGARHATMVLLLAQYLLALGLVLGGLFSWPLLLVFASTPSLVRCLTLLRAPKPTARPAEYPAKIWPLWFSAACFRHTRRFTSLFLLAVVVTILL